MESRSRKSTMVELVEELEKLRPLFLKTGPGADDVLNHIIADAKAGEFHDYKNQKYVCGKQAIVSMMAQLTEQCVKRGFSDLAKALAKIGMDVKNGDYDEEADADDKAMMAQDLAGMGLH